jgi:hypothetical protein
MNGAFSFLNAKPKTLPRINAELPQIFVELGQCLWVSTTLVAQVSLCHHSFHHLLFWGAGNNTGQVRFYNNLTLLILEHRFSFGAVTVIELGDGKPAFNRVAKIDRLPKTKVHFGRQPPDLAADLCDQAGYQKSVTNAAEEILYLGKAIVKMHGIIVLADIRKSHRVLFREGSGNGKTVAAIQPRNRFFSNM